MMRHNRTIRSTTVAAALVLTLSACGSTPEERGLTGAGMGAATGAIIGAASGGLSVVAGSLIGAGAGGALGAFTDPSRLNLGEPIWKSSSGGGTASAASDGTVSDIQAALMRRGYDPGPVDGRYGPRTAEAIRRYQSDHGLVADGRASPDLLEHMQSG